MPILDLGGDRPASLRSGDKVWKAGKRTMSPQSSPAVLQGSGGSNAGGFAAAKINRLTMDFIASSRSADQDLFGDNIRLRARARKLALDNPFARKFLQMVRQNVVGAAEGGIQLKSTVTSVNDKDTSQTEYINKRIDEEWQRWGKRGRCTACGRFSWADVQLQAIANIAREGENLVKFVYGDQFNETRFALQPLDNDQLDDTMMQGLGSGGEIRMGVEVDQYRKPLAYWLWDGHPYDVIAQSRQRKRIGAEFIVHTAVWERPGQTRGYTWMAASILAMNQYARYEEAVIVASRASAAKFMVVEQDAAEGYTGEDEDREGNDTNADGTQLMTANAGEALMLDVGQKANFIDPKFPTTTHKEFTQTMLRNVASGLLVMYPSLGNDLEGVNFSSIRAGLIDERDMWKIVQRWFGECFCAPVRMAWLRMALLTTLRDITLTPQQMEQFSIRGRGWEWVDPAKDAQATILKLGEGLSTYEIDCAKLGLDWQDVAKQRKKEQDYFAKLGVVYGVDITGDQGGKGVAAGDENEAAKAQGGPTGQNGAGKK